MQCQKCNKEMGRAGIDDPTLIGLSMELKIEPPLNTPENIAYYNKQVGKYSDGNGGCCVGICYECYIDGLFQVK